MACVARAFSVPLCKTLSDDDREKLSEVMEEVSFDPNERIIAQGESADAMWVTLCAVNSTAGISSVALLSGRVVYASVLGCSVCMSY
eukprot:COSAG02_NODE_581_length_20056_cov_9.304906_7_plen_87_part_00